MITNEQYKDLHALENALERANKELEMGSVSGVCVEVENEDRQGPSLIRIYDDHAETFVWPGDMGAVAREIVAMLATIDSKESYEDPGPCGPDWHEYSQIKLWECWQPYDVHEQSPPDDYREDFHADI